MINLLVGASLKGTLVLAVAFLAAWIARRSSADLRHRIWLGALIAMAVLLVPVPVVEPARLSVFAVSVAPSRLGHAAAPVMWTTWVLWLWAAGALLTGARFFAGLIRLVRITKASQPEFANVRSTSRVGSPLTWGLLRPEILLPKYARIGRRKNAIGLFATNRLILRAVIGVGGGIRPGYDLPVLVSSAGVDGCGTSAR